MHGHIANHIKNSTLTSDNTLHVVGVIANPVRYHSRMRLFKQWRDEMLQTPNVELHVVEAVYGDRQPECAPEPGQHYNYHQVRVDSEIWLKENLINIGVKTILPRNWKYLAWVDCDVHFRDPGWALSTLHQLQHYNIVQPWSDAMDLTHHGEVYGHFKSFGSLCAKRKKKWHGKGKDGYTYAHTGFAWACTRFFYENVRILPDWNIVGAGDHLLAWACLGMVDETMPKSISKGYKQLCYEWQEKAVWACAKSVGYVSGRIEHFHHGKKVNRKYWSRWEILGSNDYDPTKDVAYDSQGVLKLKAKPQLEQDLMLYNRQREEDSIDQE